MCWRCATSPPFLPSPLHRLQAKCSSRSRLWTFNINSPSLLSHLILDLNSDGTAEQDLSFCRSEDFIGLNGAAQRREARQGSCRTVIEYGFISIKIF
jgi:hypothetical protein